MSVVHVQTATIHGSRVIPATIEVDIQRGLPLFSIIGLPDKRIEEAKERVRAAIKNSGYTFPLGKITVNLSPSSIHKQGTGFDLGIALGVLIASGAIPQLSEKVWVLGELSLSGKVLASHHLLTLLLEALRSGVTGCIIPAEQIEQAALVEGCPVFGGESLKQVVEQLQKKTLTFQSGFSETKDDKERDQYQLDQIIGQFRAKRALAIALAGRLSLLLTGPAGSGKSMLARSAQELLPALSKEELLTTAQLHSYAGYSYSLASALPPYRTPLPSVSRSSLLGGGRPLVPGEISLAHNGVLFLDEFPEMARPVREALRLPMQEKQIEHIRDGVSYRFPARSVIIAAQNPCPCGLRGVKEQRCRCTPGEIQRYRAALSQPILDRFDIFCEVPLLKAKEWKEKKVPAELTGKHIANRIAATRKQVKEKPPPFSEEAIARLHRAVDIFKLSGRAVDSLKRVATTISLFDDFGEVGLDQILEALQYRQMPTL